MFAPAARRAFSLIELVIVVVIIGIIAAIAIPRMSRGATGASDGALSANLAVLRNAIDLFQTEHGGTYPALGTFTAQMTQYTDLAGTTTSATKTTTCYFGPYLRSVPPLPVGANKGSNALVATLGGAAGWVYEATTGNISANCPDSETDASGKKYNTY